MRRARCALPAFAARRNVGVIANGVAETKNLPVAGRRVPFQNSIGGKIFGQIQNIARVGVRLAGRGGNFLEQRLGRRRGKRFERLLQGFLFPILQRRMRGGVFDAIGDHGGVAVKIFARVRFRQSDFNVRAAGDFQFRPDIFFRGVLLRHARAAEIPAALDVQTHFEAEAIGFAQRVFIKFTPCG